MALTQSQKARQDLARKRAKKSTFDLSKLSLEQKKRQQATGDPLGTWSLAWKTVVKTWFKEEQADAAFKEQQRIFKLRQACEAKGWTFNTVTEQCSMWIQEDLAVTPTWNLEKDIALWLSFRGKWPTKEQEIQNLIARWDIKQVEWMDLTWVSEETLSALTWAKELKKTTLEKKLEKTKEAAKVRKKFELKQKALEAAAPWIERWAEAPTIALARWVEWILTERAAIIEEEFAINQQAIASKQEELNEALRTWRVDLVRQARWAMLDLRKQELNLKAQATTDVIETMWDTLLGKSEDELAQIALDQNVDLWLLKLQQEKLELKDKTAEAKTKIATQKQSQTFVKWLNNDQLWALTSKQAKALNESSWLPEWTIQSWMIRAQEINKLKDEEQRLANIELQADIDKTNAQANEITAKEEVEQIATPTWVQESVTMTDWRTINIDSVWKESLTTINEQLWTEWLRLWAVATSWARSLEQQQRLYGQWRTREELEAMWIDWDFAQPNKPIVTDADWVQSKSLHQTWLAIDLFPDKAYIERVRPTLEANWWFQDPELVKKWDVWHFEYRWVQVSPQLQAQIRGFVQSRSWVKDKDARLQLQSDILSEIQSWRAKTPAEAKINLWIVSVEDKEVKKRIQSDLSPTKKDTSEIDRNVKNILELTELEGWIWDTAAITAFLKTIDPWSVARESEVEWVENARWLIDNVVLFFVKMKAWDRLSPSQKVQLKDVASRLWKLANWKLLEQLITWKQELLDRWVEPTPISDFQINKLIRDLWPEEAKRIYEENWLTMPWTEPQQIDTDLEFFWTNDWVIVEDDLTEIDDIYWPNETPN